MLKQDIDEIIIRALKEDVLLGDITTDNILDKLAIDSARLISKDTGVIAGIDIAKRVFQILDQQVIFESYIKDGDLIKNGDIIAEIKGNTRSLLKAERTALNFLQRLSGIATKTRQFCEQVKGMNTKIADTRKTTPGLRGMEKYAVKMGGGSNHRFCLSDGVLIKDNHIKAAGSIKKAITCAKQHIPHTIKIEVEVETLEQVKEALECGADIIMLDNMGVDMLKEAVKLVDKRTILEASGNININNVKEVASTGVDIISVGGLTHSVNAFDISMRFN